MTKPIILTDDVTLPANLARPVVAIGNFDGLHRGHRAVLEAASRMAGQMGRPAALLTFEPHPASIFRPGTPLFRLTTPQIKAHLAGRMGLDGTLVLPFDTDLAALSAESFLDDILLKRLGVSGLAVGHDFHFGKGRGGSPALLAAWGAANNVPVAVVEPVKSGEAPVSSSAIRAALAQGDIGAANAALGYRWFVRATIAHGDKRGRELGYPTANMILSPDCGLRHGIYAVRISVNGALHDGIASFGRRPTFDDGAPRLETFIFDFSGDIYGLSADVEFIAFIREELKFDDVASLIVQMDSDCLAAKAALAAVDNTPSMIG